MDGRFAHYAKGCGASGASRPPRTERAPPQDLEGRGATGRIDQAM